MELGRRADLAIVRRNCKLSHKIQEPDRSSKTGSGVFSTPTALFKSYLGNGKHKGSVKMESNVAGLGDLAQQAIPNGVSLCPRGERNFFFGQRYISKINT